MTLAELIAELKTAGLLDRARSLKCSGAEVVLDAPADGERKTMVIAATHGTGISEDEAKRLEELELREGIYGAAQGFIPSDYGPT